MKVFYVKYPQINFKIQAIREKNQSDENNLYECGLKKFFSFYCFVFVLLDFKYQDT